MAREMGAVFALVGADGVPVDWQDNRNSFDTSRYSQYITHDKFSTLATADRQDRGRMKVLRRTPSAQKTEPRSKLTAKPKHQAVFYAEYPEQWRSVQK
jgi:hypothetical protein